MIIFQISQISIGKLCGAMFVDETFNQKIPQWVGERKWKRLGESAKKDWEDRNWEFGLKRKFNGAEQEWGLALPLEVLVSQGLKLKILSRTRKKARPPVRGHEMQLQR
jgi:hypothetical protein